MHKHNHIKHTLHVHVHQVHKLMQHTRKSFIEASMATEIGPIL